MGCGGCGQIPLPTVGDGKDQMDVISRLLKNRILMLGSEVNDEVGNVLVGCTISSLFCAWTRSLRYGA